MAKSITDQYMKAYRGVVEEQDKFLETLQPGKERLYAQLDDDQVLANYDTMIRGSPEHLLNFARIGVQRQGLEENEETVTKYATDFAREMEALRRKKVRNA